ncbi:MAG: capsular polysaccharide biosynthesis protein [Paracoccus sp. (in: a-proteobacteria)]|nr:capsular polysaccharide biosynthesis protein [Paracoccus sp. (in: a-proteobacteria)]
MSRDYRASTAAGGITPRRLFVFNGGFLRGDVRRILDLAGWTPRLGLPGPGDAVGIWGGAGTAWRGRFVAARRAAGLVHVEDAFLRGIMPGRAGRRGGPGLRRGPLGLIVDPLGLHFDPERPSLIETLVTSGEAARHSGVARAAIARLIAADLSKYNAHLPDAEAPAPGYVLLVDQTRGDASLMGAGPERFAQMLAAARAEHPGARVVIRTHPETAQGLRAGHFSPDDLRPGDEMNAAPVSPWRLLAGAKAVYTVSSQLGYEAMLAGHRPRLFGQPFYAGWGLSDDEAAPARRGRATLEDLFAASHLLAPIWYDPCAGRLTDFEGALRQLEAEIKAWRQDRNGHLAYGMRLWKRGAIARSFGHGGRVRFTSDPAAPASLAWAGRAGDLAAPPRLRVEDGFIRSRGLGADLIPPLSLVADDLGIYYDPARPSRLEALIAAPLEPSARARAEALVAQLIAAKVSKYNLSADAFRLPPRDGRLRILVPGQVADDASIRLGATGQERSDAALLARTRRENPGAFIIYKPHPDVEAGLRPRPLGPAETAPADLIAARADPLALLTEVDEVWTLTSTLGFEALLRGVRVTTLGAPFYAGWGLTRDLAAPPARRQARPDLIALAHAALIEYPRYFDPEASLPCPPERAIELLAIGAISTQRRLRALAKLQGALAGQSWLWRR